MSGSCVLFFFIIIIIVLLLCCVLFVLFLCCFFYLFVFNLFIVAYHFIDSFWFSLSFLFITLFTLHLFILMYFSHHFFFANSVGIFNPSRSADAVQDGG